jgi:hypothetical protein
MRTVLDVANTYEDWARRDDEMANSIIAQLSNYEQETQAHYRYDVSALQEEARHFREQAERLREQHRRAAEAVERPC